MQQRTLTVLDTTGIQNYIFGSNKLRENIGASQLVEKATCDFVRDALDSLGLMHNLDASCKPNDAPSYRLEDNPALQVEVILRGGGNVLLLFRSRATARKLVRAYSQLLLSHAPGLEITAAHQDFDWEVNAIGGADATGIHWQLFDNLNRVKQQRRASTPLLGVGVTLECRSTSLAAVGFDPKDRARPVSAEVRAKIDTATIDEANQRLEKLLPQRINEEYQIPDELDKLGRSEGESSYIAIVHADGNRMGDLFKKNVTPFNTYGQNRECLNALRTLSIAVEKAGNTALQATIAWIGDSFSLDASEEMRRLLHDLVDDTTEKPYLPFRPIVYGGDDLTFVCDGRLGLKLAAKYLEEWEKATSADSIIGAAYACAGIAVVKAHYPFSRAYELAAELCHGTKRALREQSIEHASALDWHFAATGITGSPKEIRRRTYTWKHAGDLVMRPVTLAAPGMQEPWRTWQNIERLIDTFKHQEPWCDRHNKIIALREALRAGDLVTRQFRAAYQIEQLPALEHARDTLRTSGWVDDHCGYFDAIEALEFALPLLPVSKEAS